MKLKTEDKEQLISMAKGDGLRALQALMEGLCAEQQKQIVLMPLPQTSDRDLVIAKARAEGALKLKADITALLTRYKAS